MWTASRVASLEAASFAEVLDELGEFAARQPEVVDPERFEREVANLGADDVVGVGGGAFLPHLRTDTVRGVVSILGVTGEPLRVPTETGEETRGRLFALVAASSDASAAYLEEVATVAHLLRRTGVVEAILAAGEPAAIAALPGVADAPRIQRLSVVDVMEPAAERVFPDMDVHEAARLMVRGRYTGLPVVNKRDEIVGMISEKDLIRSFLPGYLDVAERSGAGVRAERQVKEVMSKAVLCLSTDASISDAASIIVNKNVDPLPVTREGKWVGLISRRSLIRKLQQF